MQKKESRYVTYLPSDVAKRLEDSCSHVGLSPSAFLRWIIMKEINNNNNSPKR